MNLEKINSCLAFYFLWANSKDDIEAFAELDKQLESVTSDFFAELCGNEKFKTWIKGKAHYEDEGTHLSTLAEAVRIIIGRSKNSLMKFDSENEFDSYMFLTLFGKKGQGGVAGVIRNQNKKAKNILEEKIRKKETDNKQVSDVQNEDTDLTEEDESSDDSFDYDEDGNELNQKTPLIENIADTYQTSIETKVDIALIRDTVRYLLEVIRQDLSEEDMVLEKKIAWQIGSNYEALLFEKVGLFTDPVLIAHDIATVVRYEHWHSVK